MDWSCMSQTPRVGDDAWLVRLGSDPRSVIAHAEITAEASTDAHWDKDRAQDGDTATYVEIQIDDLRDPSGGGAVPVSTLKEKLGDLQNWTPQQSGIEIKPQ